MPFSPSNPTRFGGPRGNLPGVLSKEIKDMRRANAEIALGIRQRSLRAVSLITSVDEHITEHENPYDKAIEHLERLNELPAILKLIEGAEKAAAPEEQEAAKLDPAGKADDRRLALALINVLQRGVAADSDVIDAEVLRDE